MSHAQRQGPTDIDSHAHTHFGPHSRRQPVLLKVRMVQAAQSSATMLRGFWRRSRLENGSIWLKSLHSVLWQPTFDPNFFSTFLAQGPFCGLTQGFDRTQPLPVRPLNWATTSQPGLMCQEAESPLTMNFLALGVHPHQHTHTAFRLPRLCAPHTPRTAVDRGLLPFAWAPFPFISTFSDSSTIVGNINWREFGEKRGKGGESLHMSTEKQRRW